jgi:hypothetical protein
MIRDECYKLSEDIQRAVYEYNLRYLSCPHQEGAKERRYYVILDSSIADLLGMYAALEVQTLSRIESGCDISGQSRSSGELVNKKARKMHSNGLKSALGPWSVNR